MHGKLLFPAIDKIGSEPLIQSLIIRPQLVGRGTKGTPFPIKAATVSAPGKGTLSIWDISPGGQPLRDFFKVNLKALEASGARLRVRDYRVQRLQWFPPANFGKAGGEVRAAEALERLMPIDPARLRKSRARWMEARLRLIRTPAPSVPTDHHVRLTALAEIYKTVEWGGSGTIDETAMQISPAGPHRGLDWHWNFNRAKYHREFKQTWGRKAAAGLVATLKTVAVGPGFGPVEKIMALDLLSDIGPGRTDADWGGHEGFLAKALAAARNPTASNAFTLAIFRARWGLPLSPAELTAARVILFDKKMVAAFRLRALEVLCFANRLPFRPRIIVPLVGESLKDEVACLVRPDSGRYLFDLSLCRTGRKILLQELADRHSQLAGQSLLPVAAFNRPWPGSPGYNMAAKVASRIVDDPRYGPRVRHQAFGMILQSPWPIYQHFMARRLGSQTGHFGWNMISALSERKAAAAFVPQLTSLFDNGSLKEKQHILLAIGFGVRSGKSADGFAPLIKFALESGKPALCWAGVNCIQHLRVGHARFENVQFYPQVLSLLRGGFAGNSAKGPALLNIFALTTGDRWRIPKAGMLPGGQWPNTSPVGIQWWRRHYAAVRASALAWAVAHPDYLRAAANSR